MMKVDCILIGGGWEGEIRSVDYDPVSIRHITCPVMGSVGPGGIREENYRPLEMVFHVSEFNASDGKTYIVAKSEEIKGIDLDAIIRDAYPKPKPFKQ